MNSRARFLIDFVSFINLLYIAISTSLQIGFDVKMNTSLVGAEVCSLLSPFLWLLQVSARRLWLKEKQR